MAKFVQVPTVPPELGKGEYVIAKPDFADEVKVNSSKNPRNGLTAPNQLRYIVDTIGMKYNPEGTNGWSVKPHQFIGRPFANNDELAKIVGEMLTQDHPVIYRKYVEHTLNTLPAGTDLVYLVGFADVPVATKALTDRGFEETTTDDISAL
jgi:hypothetical protein